MTTTRTRTTTTKSPKSPEVWTAARLLKMDRDWLRYRMEKHGIKSEGKPGRPAD